MGVIYVTSGLFICIIILVNRQNKFTLVPITLLVYLIVAAFFLQHPNEKKIEQKIQEYNRLKTKTEAIKSLENDDLRNIFIPDLRKEIREMNREIEVNKNRYNSWWDGYLYSQEIGNLEKIEDI